MIKVVGSIIIGVFLSFALWALGTLVFVFFGIERPPLFTLFTYASLILFPYLVFRMFNKKDTDTKR